MSEENCSERANTSAASQQSTVVALQNESIALKKSPSLTRTELIEALNCEIKQIEDEFRRPGWSAWALQGAIATLVWLAVSKFNLKLNFNTIGIVFLFGSLIVDFFLGVSYYFDLLRTFRRKQLRFRFFSEDPSVSPSILIFAIFRYSCLFCIYNSLSAGFYVPLLGWYFGVLIFLFVMMFPMRLIKILTPKRQMPTSFDHWVSWIILIWSGFLIWKLFLVLPFNETNFNVSDYHVGFLFTGITYLIWLLVTGERERPIVNTLKDIRRELAFGQIGVEEATKEADVVLSGLTAIDAVEHKLIELAQEFQSVIVSYEKLVSECDLAASLLTSLEADGNDQTNLWKENARKTVILIDSCETKKQNCQQAFNKVFFKSKSTFRSIENINKVYLGSKSGLELKWADALSKMDKLREFSETSGPLLSNIKSRYLAISQMGDFIM